MSAPITAREYGVQLADEAGPLTGAQVEAAARILASVDAEQQEQPRVA
jgi:hypothetical protein